MASIRVENLSKSFGQAGELVKALQTVSCSVHENEFFTLLGPSGCGKTTLLRLIAGFELPDSGHIYLQDRAIDHLPPHQRPVNTVFQSYALFPHLNVSENIAFGLQMLGRNRASEKARIEQMLDLVRLKGLENRRPQQLSGGQQQRVALARALACEPQVLLLDEPLSALDLKLRKEMQIELKRLQRETKITFVFVTHDQEEALAMSDRIAVMNEGHILQVGAPTDIYENPTSRFVADFIGDTNFISAECVDQANGQSRFRVDGGTELYAEAMAAPGKKVTFSIRPERIEFDETHKSNLVEARLRNVTYIGTDTLSDWVLPSGTILKVRQQNRKEDNILPSEGEKRFLHLPPSALRVLSE